MSVLVVEKELPSHSQMIGLLKLLEFRHLLKEIGSTLLVSALHKVIVNAIMPPKGGVED